MPLDTGGDGRLGRNDAVAGHRGVETFFELHKVEGVWLGVKVLRFSECRQRWLGSH